MKLVDETAKQKAIEAILENLDAFEGEKIKSLLKGSGQKKLAMMIINKNGEGEGVSAESLLKQGARKTKSSDYDGDELEGLKGETIDETQEINDDLDNSDDNKSDEALDLTGSGIKVDGPKQIEKGAPEDYGDELSQLAALLKKTRGYS